MKRARSIFAQNSYKLFGLFCAIAVILGAVPVALTAYLFGFAQNKVMPKFLNYHIDDTLSLDKVSESLKGHSVRWVSNLDFTVKTYAKKDGFYVESNDVISYSKTTRLFTFNAVGEGYISFINTFDQSLTVKLDVSSIFYSETLGRLLTENRQDITSDGIITKDELSSISKVTLLQQYSSYDFSDFKYMQNVIKFYVPSFYDDALLSGSNIDKINQDASFYVPENLYYEYQDSSFLNSFKQKDKLFVNFNQQEERKYSVIIHPNGGSTPEFDQDLYFSTTTGKLSDEDLSFMNSVAIRGKHILYWYYYENGQETQFDLNRVLDDDIHIYAKWDINRYRIRYHFNSYVDVVNDYYDIEYEYDKEGKYLSTAQLLERAPNAHIKEEEPEEDKFIFLGWAYSPNSKTVDETINDDATVFEYTDVHNDLIDLYAIWAFKKVHITYKYGADKASSKETTLYYGQSLSVGYVGGDKIDEYWYGHTFKGWGLDQETTPQFAFNDSLSLPRLSTESNYITIYGVYFERVLFQVDYYDAEDHFVVTDTNHGNKYYSDEKVNFLDAIDYTDSSFIVDGKHFIGWKDEGSSVYVYRDFENLVGYYTLPDLYQIVYIDRDDQGNYTLEKGIDFGGTEYKLTAQYIDNRFDIKFNTENGTAFNEIQEAIPGGNYDVSGTTTKHGFSNPDYTYVSVNTFDELRYDFKNEGVTPARSKAMYDQIKKQNGYDDNTFPTGTGIYDRASISFESVFTPNHHTITLNPNGGSSSKDEVEVTYEGSYEFPKPERYGYTFAGWYNGNEFYETSGTWLVDSDLTLTAHWTPISYKITYNANGGSNPNTKTTYTIEDEYTFLDAAFAGYSFTGWYDQNGVKITKIVKGTTGNITLNANWNAKTYKVIYKNGNIELNYTPNTATFNEKFTVTTSLPAAPEKKKFNQWVAYEPNGSKLDLTVGSGGSFTYRYPYNLTLKIEWVDDGCVTGDTLLTMEDHSQKAVKDIERGDMVQTLNHETGLIDYKPVFLIEKVENTVYPQFTVNLANGNSVKFLSHHDIFITDTLTYQEIDSDNYLDFVGRYTLTNVNDELVRSRIVSVFKEEVVTDAYTICVAETFNVFTNGVVTLTPNELWRPLFSIDENYQYNKAELENDIATYGLFTYEELRAIVVNYLGEDVFDEEILQYMFYSTNAKYFKIGMGKGIYTFEDLMNYMVNDTSNYM